MKKRNKKSTKIFTYVLLFLSCLIFASTNWIMKNFGLIDMDKLIYHMTNPLEGTSNEMIYSFIFNSLLVCIIIFIIMMLILNYKYKYLFVFKINIFKNYIYINTKLLITICLFVLSIYNFEHKLDVFNYIKNIDTYSNFIEENYVDPKTTKITFPENKRNLIYIFLESIEYTYASKENGGAYEENLIPNLTNYANKEISFRNSNNGGSLSSRATGWTIAAMFAQTSGLGFYVPGDGNSYGQNEKFIPGAYTLGDILKDQGYNQTLLIGSDATFGGRKQYFEQHGNYTIKDYNYAKEQKWIDEDYYVWWGYEDSKLFEFAKKELKELSKKDEPFNLTLLTVNTHHIGGYLENDCEQKYDEQLKNVVLCSDKQVYEFVEWIKEQDFYENTTIVITGDHLSMEPTFFKNLDGYQRTPYNVFINSIIKTDNFTNRNFYSMDIFPTTISSLGGIIEGNRLGLGTNLFSNEKTLYEEYGVDEVEKQLSYNSSYYKNRILSE